MTQKESAAHVASAYLGLPVIVHLSTLGVSSVLLQLCSPVRIRMHLVLVHGFALLYTHMLCLQQQHRRSRCSVVLSTGS